MSSLMIPFRFPGVPNVRCAFSLRAFGNVSLTRDNDTETAARRASIPAALGANAFAEAHQVHGVRTLFEPQAQDPALSPSREADGMATSRPGLALMVKSADCQPILVAHESGRYVMAIHCGWKGNYQDYPVIAVREFCEHYGVKASELWAVRGPSLGPAAAEFVNFEKEWGKDFLPWFDQESRTMDLWGLARAQLSRAGIRSTRILGLDLCTFANSEDFFSYRRFYSLGGDDGRQGSFIWIDKKQLYFFDREA